MPIMVILCCFVKKRVFCEVLIKTKYGAYFTFIYKFFCCSKLAR